MSGLTWLDYVFVNQFINRILQITARNTWKVVTKTSSSHKEAKSDSKIYIEIRGTSGNSPRLDLENTDKDDFELGATDTFWFTDVWNVGEVKSIVLYMPHDDDGWKVDSVFLTNDPLTGVTYVFENRARRWLDGGDDPGNVGHLELTVRSKSPGELQRIITTLKLMCCMYL